MSENKPALSTRYFLTLEESQDGFALATFGKKVGRYYVALGIFFLVLQILMRYWFLPMMFKRQFVKYQFGKSEQGIDLYQDYAEIYANGRKQVVHYNEVQKFASGKLTYMLELKNRTVVIVPKRALADSADQAKFENTFKK